MAFRVEFKHDDGLSIEFRDPLANANTYTNGGCVTIAFRDDDEAHAFFEAVEQEQAARYGDFDDPKTDERKTEAWLDTLPTGGDKE